MKIRVGVSSIHGEILEDYDKAKACNICTLFKGYGLHCFSGYCTFYEEDIDYSRYSEMAKQCKQFNCIPDLLRP